MLGWFGLSHRLPELPSEVRERLSEHIRFYKSTVKEFIRTASHYRFTGQVLKDREGDDRSAFQYVLPDRSRSLLFVFRLPSSSPSRMLKLKGLDAEKTYRFLNVDTGSADEYCGRQLMNDGIVFDGLRERESAVIILERVK